MRGGSRAAPEIRKKEGMGLSVSPKELEVVSRERRVYP